jgi:hypothetical protein
MPRKNPLICDHFAIIFYQTEAFALQYRSKHRHFSSNLMKWRGSMARSRGTDEQPDQSATGREVSGNRWAEGLLTGGGSGNLG